MYFPASDLVPQTEGGASSVLRRTRGLRVNRASAAHEAEVGYEVLLQTQNPEVV